MTRATTTQTSAGAPMRGTVARPRSRLVATLGAARANAIIQRPPDDYNSRAAFRMSEL